jgi:DMSO/TMAO reductase YedYZ heme-binding membrane subunit
VKKDTFWPVVYFVVFAVLLGVRLWRSAWFARAFPALSRRRRNT